MKVKQRTPIGDRVRAVRATDLRQLVGADARPYSGGYVSISCPFHEDSVPSCLVYADHFVCLSSECGVNGSIFDWMAGKWGYNDVPRGAAFLTFLTRVEQELVIAPRTVITASQNIQEIDLDEQVKTYHYLLRKSPARYNYFFGRGFVKSYIDWQMFGWDGMRYSIPIWEGRPRDSQAVSIRFRASELYDGARYSGVTGYNENRLYNSFVLKENVPVVFVVYGLFDAALGLQEGLPMVSPSNGDLSVRSEWFKEFNGDVIFIPDYGAEDEAMSDAGQIGSRGWILRLPPMKKGKDLTDWFRKVSARAGAAWLIQNNPSPSQVKLVKRVWRKSNGTVSRN